MENVMCVVINVMAFFDMHVCHPVANFFRARRRAYRTAGMLLLLVLVPTHAQAAHSKLNRKRCQEYLTEINHARMAEDVEVDLYRDAYDEMLLRQLRAEYSDGDGLTGVPALDNAIMFVWNNCGKLIILFGLLAWVCLLRDKLDGNETYGEKLQRDMQRRVNGKAQVVVER